MIASKEDGLEIIGNLWLDQQNTFSSNEDCEMFIMVLKQQWPKHINKLPDSELEITRSIESPNIMSAIWTLKDHKHFDILEKINTYTHEYPSILLGEEPVRFDINGEFKNLKLIKIYLITNNKKMDF